MKIVNIGIIGAGNIARTFATAGEYASNAKITAVASRTLEKSENFAKEYNIEKAYGSYQEILDDITNYFPELVFKTVIPRNIRLAEAPSYGLPIKAYEKGSVGAKAYDELAKEVVARV